ncbi:hypothetical protein IV203_036895 [Nitzschia inconspicua]|uniref:SET domain-containing protein n=1 Tax=Nitzschia inconspicua TaxID=303405 RepID=A0A9K3LHK6_9STRA|nr:hypothetical protein IV203_036895 [Nitzschia inconspicua]
MISPSKLRFVTVSVRLLYVLFSVTTTTRFPLSSRAFSPMESSSVNCNPKHRAATGLPSTRPTSVPRALLLHTTRRKRPASCCYRPSCYLATSNSQSLLQSVRNMEWLESWAVSHGVQFDPNIQLMATTTTATTTATAKSFPQDSRNSVHNISVGMDDNDDWTLRLVSDQSIATAATKMTTPTNILLTVPSHLVLSSETIRERFNATELAPSLKDIENYLSQRNAEGQIPQFYLFLQLLSEYHQGPDSLWYPWIQSLPKRYDTAVCMDDVELECLPPFAWALAKVERYHFDLFRQAITKLSQKNDGQLILPDVETYDTTLLQWIFNTVFTRCWRFPDLLPNGRERCDIVPLGDMFNHNANPTVEIDYDDKGNVEFSLLPKSQEPFTTQDNLAISYGLPTNPYRFLVIFGFVDEKQPEVFCQLVAKEPSRQLVDMGYDSTKMVFRTSDGAISNAVWNVMLYQLLEQVPALQQQLYQAHISNQTHITSSMHEQYHLETCLLLSRHVYKSLDEFQDLLENANVHSCSQHPRLHMIQRHLKFMIDTFLRVQCYLKERIQDETRRRMMMIPTQKES